MALASCGKWVSSSLWTKGRDWHAWAGLRGALQGPGGRCSRQLRQRSRCQSKAGARTGGKERPGGPQCPIPHAGPSSPLLVTPLGQLICPCRVALTR